jgi:hypothetical protein
MGLRPQGWGAFCCAREGLDISSNSVYHNLMNIAHIPLPSTAGVQQKLHLLPLSARSEALDFIDFLLKKYQTHPAAKPKVGCMRGAFVRMSDDFNAPHVSSGSLKTMSVCPRG